MDREMGITVTGDIDDVKSSLSDLNDTIEGLADKIINIGFEIDFSSLDELSSQLEDVTSSEKDVTLGIDDEFTIPMDSIEETLNEYVNSSHTISIDLSDSDVVSELENLETTINNALQDVSISVGLDTDIQAELDEILDKLVQIDEFVATPTIEIDNYPIEEVISMLDEINMTVVSPEIDTEGIDNFNNDTNDTNKNFNDIEASASSLGELIGAIGTIWATYSIEDRVLEFDKWMDRAQVLTGATAEEMAQLGEQARTLFTASIPIKDIAQAQMSLATETGNVNDALDMMPGIMDMVKVSGADLNKTTNVAVNLFEKFNGTALDTGDLMTYMAAATTQMTMTGDQVASTIERLSTQLVQMGLSGQDAVNMMWAFDKSGLSSREITMAMRTGFTSLISAWKEGDSKLAGIEAGFKKLGIATRDANGQLLPLNELVIQAADKLSTMENGTEKTQIAVDIFGKTAMRTFGILSVAPSSAASAFGDSAESIVADVRKVNAEHMTLQQKLTKLYDWFISLIPSWAAELGALVATVGGSIIAIVALVRAAEAQVVKGTAGMVTTWIAGLGSMLTAAYEYFIAILASTTEFIVGLIASFSAGGLSGAIAFIIAQMKLLATSTIASMSEFWAAIVAGAYGSDLALIATAIQMMVADVIASLQAMLVAARAWLAEFVALISGGEIMAALSMLVAAFRGAVIAIDEIIGPVGWVILGITALIAVIYELGNAYGWWTTAQDKANTALEETKKTLEGNKKAVSEAGDQVDYWQKRVNSATPGTQEYATAVEKLQTAKQNYADAADKANKAEDAWQKSSTEHTKVMNDYNNALDRASRSIIAYKVATGEMTQEEGEAKIADLEKLKAVDEADKAIIEATKNLNAQADAQDKTNKETKGGLPGLRALQSQYAENTKEINASTSSWDLFVNAVKAVFDWTGPQILLHIIQDLWHWITGNSPGLMPAWSAFVSLITQPFNVPLLNYLIDGAKDIYNNFMNNLAWLQRIPYWVTTQLNLMGYSFFNGLANIPVYVSRGLVNIYNNFMKGLDWIPGLPEWVKTNVGNIGGGFLMGILSWLGTVRMGIFQFRTNFMENIQWLIELPVTAFEWGKNFIKQFRDGILSGLDSLVSGLSQFAKYLEGHSPTEAGPLSSVDRWGYSVGITYSDSVALGIAAGASNVATATEEIVSAAETDTTELSNNAFLAGNSISTSVAEGLTSGTSEITSAAESTANVSSDAQSTIEDAINKSKSSGNTASSTDTATSTTPSTAQVAQTTTNVDAILAEQKRLDDEQKKAQEEQKKQIDEINAKKDEATKKDKQWKDNLAIFKPVTDAIGGFVGYVKDNLGGIPDYIGGLFKGVKLPELKFPEIKLPDLGSVKGVLDGFIGGIQGAWKGLQDFFADPGTSLGNMVGDAIEGVLGAVNSLLDGLIYVRNNIGPAMQGIYDGIVNGFNWIVQSISGSGADAWTAVVSFGQYIYNGLMSIPGTLQTAWNNIVAGFNNFITYLGTLPGTAYNTLVSLGQRMYLALAQIPVKIQEGLTFIWNKFVDFSNWLKNLPNMVLTSITKTFTDMVNYIKSIPNQVASALRSIWDKFVDFTNWIKSLPGIIWTNITQAFDNFVNAIKSRMPNINKQLDEIKQKIKCLVFGCSPGVLPYLNQLTDGTGEMMSIFGSKLQNGVANASKIAGELPRVTSQITDSMKSVGDLSVNVTPLPTGGSFQLPVEQVTAMQKELTPVEPKIEVKAEITVRIDKIEAKDDEEAKRLGNKVGEGVVETVTDELGQSAITNGVQIINGIR